jgi:hypothetical protein
MEKRARSAIAWGVILVVGGAVVLAWKLVPGLFGGLSWPFLVIGPGVLLLVLAVATGNAGLAVPACIVGGIGIILCWQNLTGRWDTWRYAWALIPGFVGVGALVQGLLEARPLKAILDALWPILVSAVLFAVFSSLAGEGPFAGVEPYYLGGGALILVGVLVMLRPLVRRAAKPAVKKEE